MAYKRKHLRQNNGFTLVEMLVVTLLSSIIFTGGFILFSSGQMAWAMTNTRIYLQENLRRSTERISIELSASGRDSSNTLRFELLDNSGVNNSDIIRFSIPLCTCGTSVMDANAEIRTWGAPPTWYSGGCQISWTPDVNGNVTICHVANGTNMDVLPSSVNAHLAHGDRIGTCASCDPTVYTNRKIEYLLDNNKQLLRRVLDNSNAVLSTVVIAPDIADFQAVVNTNVVTITMQLTKNALPNRTITLNSSFQVVMRNYD